MQLSFEAHPPQLMYESHLDSSPEPHSQFICEQFFGLQSVLHSCSIQVLSELQFPQLIVLLHFVSFPEPQSHPICEQEYGTHTGTHAWFSQFFPLGQFPQLIVSSQLDSSPEPHSHPICEQFFGLVHSVMQGRQTFFTWTVLVIELVAPSLSVTVRVIGMSASKIPFPPVS